MANYSLFLVLVLAIVGFSCSDADHKDCICTLEYRGYSVYIVDSNHQPIDSLVTWVTNKNSSTIYRIDPSSIVDPYRTIGRYLVLTDGEMKYFTSIPMSVIFHASNRKYSVTGLFTFNVDDCRCHLQKVAGPDSIVVQ